MCTYACRIHTWRDTARSCSDSHTRDSMSWLIMETVRERSRAIARPLSLSLSNIPRQPRRWILPRAPPCAPSPADVVNSPEPPYSTHFHPFFRASPARPFYLLSPARPLFPPPHLPLPQREYFPPRSSSEGAPFFLPCVLHFSRFLPLPPPPSRWFSPPTVRLLNQPAWGHSRWISVPTLPLPLPSWPLPSGPQRREDPPRMELGEDRLLWGIALWSGPSARESNPVYRGRSFALVYIGRNGDAPAENDVSRRSDRSSVKESSPLACALFNLGSARRACSSFRSRENHATPQRYLFEEKFSHRFLKHVFLNPFYRNDIPAT